MNVRALAFLFTLCISGGSSCCERTYELVYGTGDAEYSIIIAFFNLFIDFFVHFTNNTTITTYLPHNWGSPAREIPRVLADLNFRN